MTRISLNSLKKVCLTAVILLASTQTSLADDDIKTMVDNFNKYIEAGNYAKASEELTWIKAEVDKLNNKNTEKFFPAELLGYKGGEIQASNAMGMTNIERTYTKDSSSITVSLVGGGKGSPMGSLAGFAGMAAMMGGAGNSVRIQGKTATVTDSGTSSEMTIFLDSGSMLQFRGAAVADLKKLAEAFEISKLDASLKGQ